MFRKGGEVMSGIMTGIKPRQNYDNGDLVRAAEEEAAAYKKFAGPTGSDALANLLIQGGLGLVSGEGAAKKGGRMIRTKSGGGAVKRRIKTSSKPKSSGKALRGYGKEIR